jgi:hypothetical protein
LWRASWSSLEVLGELIPKDSSLTLISCVNNKLQNRHEVWTCYVISMPSGGLVANHNRNQCITSTQGWPKFTVNISPMLKPCSSSSKFSMDISIAFHCSYLELDHTWESIMLSKFIFVKVP